MGAEQRPRQQFKSSLETSQGIPSGEIGKRRGRPPKYKTEQERRVAKSASNKRQYDKRRSIQREQSLQSDLLSPTLFQSE